MWLPENFKLSAWLILCTHWTGLPQLATRSTPTLPQSKGNARTGATGTVSHDHVTSLHRTWSLFLRVWKTWVGERAKITLPTFWSTPGGMLEMGSWIWSESCDEDTRDFQSIVVIQTDLGTSLTERLRPASPAPQEGSSVVLMKTPQNRP